MRLGVLELVVILAIIVVLFGSKQIPKLTDAVISSMKSFKEGMKKDDKDAVGEEEKTE